MLKVIITAVGTMDFSTEVSVDDAKRIIKRAFPNSLMWLIYRDGNVTQVWETAFNRKTWKRSKEESIIADRYGH